VNQLTVTIVTEKGTITVTETFKNKQLRHIKTIVTEKFAEEKANMLYLSRSDLSNVTKYGIFRHKNSIFSTGCNIYISRLCYDVSVRLSVRLSVTEVHWRIIANLSFKFRSHFTAHCGRRAACGQIISRHASQC